MPWKRIAGRLRVPPFGSAESMPDDRLNGFQADFSLVLGAGSANPDDAAALGAGRLFIEDQFD